MVRTQGKHLHHGAGHKAQGQKRLALGVHPGENLACNDGRRKKAVYRMKSAKLKDLKPGTWFIRKPNEYPTEKQVLIRGNYDRGSKRYSCAHWDDICREITLKGETVVYIDFTF